MAAENVYAKLPNADPSLLKPNTGAIGYPSRDSKLDPWRGFVEPPIGYGDVPFYWWIGDTLTKERLSWQLDQFREMGISGFQINYCHSDKGGLLWGLTYPSDPPLFSDKWWKLVQWWSGECQKQNISISLSDYTLQGVGQGYWTDEILRENPDMRGRYLDRIAQDVDGGKSIEIGLPENLVSATAYKLGANGVEPDSTIDLSSAIKDNKIVWNAPEGKWRVVSICYQVVDRSLDPMNLKTGPEIIKKFFGRFEDHLPGQGGKGLNFFFSDELDFGIRGNLWNDRFREAFKAVKGYDIGPKLNAIWEDIGQETPKIRMDYYDMVVRLQEEGYFEPVFKWHYDRGMVYGCDHGGRGRDITEFGDYFRTQRWMTGPGCDQPGLSSDIIKNKVASSIAHLYQRPRTWLEGYYGSGWGTSTQQLTDATVKNFVMGQNLLSLHGLYYTTHGGYWEWAPPCNHFRMPYWAHMDKWFKMQRRLSYLMSQGVHRCDVAVIYPVASKEAGLDGDRAVRTAFGIVERLYSQGIDCDFIDFESLDRAKIKDKELQVSGEAYRVLIIPAMKAIRYSSIRKALEFCNAGGIVLAEDALPEASDRIGRNDPELNSIVKDIFGISTADLAASPGMGSTKLHPNGGVGSFSDAADNITIQMNQRIKRDFASAGKCYVNHRKIGKRDVFMVVGAQKGSKCYFKATGNVELWDPWTGTAKPLSILSQTDGGTEIVMPLEANEAQIIVFTAGQKPVTVPQYDVAKRQILPLDGQWSFELKPTLDNRFGDFRQPATNTLIGAEARKFQYSESDNAKKSYSVTHGFGQKFWKLGPLPKGTDTGELESKLAAMKSIDPLVPVSVAGKDYFWHPYSYSDRLGVEGDPGHEGHHGLKEQISDDFIALGRRNDTNTDTWYSNESDNAGRYYLWTTVINDTNINAKVLTGEYKPSSVWLNGNHLSDLSGSASVSDGANPLLLRYESAGRGHFVLLAGEDQPAPRTPLAMSWYLKPGVLRFHPMAGAEHAGIYKFTVPPAMKSMKLKAFGTPQAWIGVDQMKIDAGLTQPDGSTEYVITPKAVVAELCEVTLKIAHKPGYYGGAAIPEPIAFDCGVGSISLGDWSQMGVLETYSGGAIYGKTVNLTPQQVKSNLVIDLGDVVSSAEVFVNGKSAGVRLASPWTIDISKYVKSGDNEIKVLVYNTLGNHYITIPTRYRGMIKSGLIGPVNLVITPVAR